MCRTFAGDCRLETFGLQVGGYIGFSAWSGHGLERWNVRKLLLETSSFIPTSFNRPLVSFSDLEKWSSKESGPESTSGS